MVHPDGGPHLIGICDMNESLRQYVEFSANYLPDLFNYVVPILNANKELGSGVLVNFQGRHIVATARHCIENKPRVFLPVSRIRPDDPTSTQQIRIVRTEFHETLDIGFLEIEDPGGSEVGSHQLCKDRISDKMVHVIGFPSVKAFVDWPNNNVSVLGGSFGTTLLEEADEFLKFDYPKVGGKFDPTQNGWTPSAFPETPEGFSGGGCFSVTVGTTSGVQIIEYKLHGIQCSWSEYGRAG